MTIFQKSNPQLKQLQLGDQAVNYRIIAKPDATDNQPHPLIIGLHGHGSDESQLETLVSLDINQPYHYIAPRGFHTLDDGGFTWFPVTNTANGFQYDANVVIRSLSLLRDFVLAATTALSADPDNIYLVGYSQGGTMSLAYTLLYSETICASVAMAGILLDEIKAYRAADALLQDHPLFIGHGLMDSLISKTEIEATARYLHDKGVAVDLRHYRIPHVVSAAERRDVSAWLNNLMMQRLS